MFHVKHREWATLGKMVSRETSSPGALENTILQNNPMHQKIVAVLQ
jgi:hypothetical protein